MSIQSRKNLFAGVSTVCKASAERAKVTYVDIAIIQNFFDGFPCKHQHNPVIGKFRDASIPLHVAVQTWWYFPGLLKQIFTTYDGDAEDHAAVRSFCEQWRRTHIHPGTLTFVRLHEAWLAKAAVSTVLAIKQAQK
jgi:hypothetical protein